MKMLSRATLEHMKGAQPPLVLHRLVTITEVRPARTH
jgi:hypothetical protein